MIRGLGVVMPFAVGILIHRLWHCWWAPIALLTLAAGIYITLSINSKAPNKRLELRPYLTISLAIAALAIGWLTAVIHCPPKLADGQLTGRVLQGRIARLDYTDFSMRLTIDVLDKELPPCKVLVSTRGCDYLMRPGDLVAWHAELEQVSNLGNPGEMDYAAYLRDCHGIRYHQHLPLDQVKKTGYSPTIMTRIANVRRHLSLMVFNSRLSTTVQRLVVALLLGESRMIDQDARTEFSAAGIAHVLALSGLHIGIIAWIVWILLFPLDYLRKKKLRLALTLAAIALFAVFTGFTPSVVRAAIMIGFAFASIIFSRRSMPLNSLCMAALVILVFDPSALYSVGFQLSFITVGAILLFGSKAQLPQSSHKVVSYFTATIITSAIAMLATMALTAHYFHTISWASVLSNLLVLPVLPVFMLLGALFLLFLAAGMQWPLLDTCIDAIGKYIHWVASSVSSIPLSHVTGIYVSTCGTILFLAALIFVALWLYQRRYKYLLVTGCTLAAMLAHSLWIDAHTTHRGLIIFNSFSSTPILYYEGDTGHVWCPDEEANEENMKRYYSGFLARHSINDIRLIRTDSTSHIDGGLISPPFAHLLGHRLFVADRGNWKKMTATSKLDFDEIIVTKHFHGTISKLLELNRFDRIIISGAVQPATLESLLHECDSLGISAHVLARDGAIEMTPMVRYSKK